MKEDIITDMLIELERGVKRAECLAIIGKKWQISDRTFDRYWKKAQEQHKDRQKDTQRVIADTSTTAAVDRLKSAILTKEEALTLLTGIANEATKLTPTGIASAKSEQISAIKTIAELEGWNEAVKVEDVTKKGTIIKLSNGMEIEI